eukprot:TRINITY_DN6371_c0_g1_i1.p1 TRINITY_DN6371_c0_g1~~TRINITY_DN6371_c0_g1_i1.p1  ORF type:complete len:739 (-),score=111.45 TRINITY_DN6371_c0_g1_i1:1079-3295(-)
MSFSRVALCFILLLFASATSIFGARVLFVGSPNDALTEEMYAAISIVVQELNDQRYDIALPPDFLPIVLQPFWLSAYAAVDIKALFDLCNNTLTRPSLFISTTSSRVASAVGPQFDILTIYVGKSDSVPLIQDAPLKLVLPETADSVPSLAESALDALVALNLTNVFKMADASQLDIPQSLPTTSLLKFSPNTEILQVQPSSDNYAHSYALRRLSASTAGVVFMVSLPSVFSAVMRYPGPTPMEWLWVDETAGDRPTFLDVDTSFYSSASPFFATPKNIFAVQPFENFTLSAALSSNISSAPLNTSRADFVLSHEHIHARDAVMIWASAISELGNATASGAAIFSVLARNSTPDASERQQHRFIGGPYLFHSFDGRRIRLRLLKNLRADINPPAWVDVGTIRGSNSTQGGLGSVQFFPSATLRFASGTSKLPATRQSEVVCTMVDSFTGSSPLWDPIHTAWIKIARFAAKISRPLGVVPVNDTKLNLLLGDTKNRWIDTVRLGFLANIFAGSRCRLGPSSSRLVRAALSSDPTLQVSFATSSDAFSDRAAFPGLFQFVTPFRFQATATAKFVVGNQWSRICTLKSRDDDSQEAEVVFVAAAESEGLSLVSRPSYNDLDPASITSALQDLKKQKCRIVLAFVEWTSFPRVLELASSEGELFGRKGMQWIFSESSSYLFWLRTSSVSTAPNLDWSLLDGSLLVRPAEGEASSSKYSNFSSLIQNITGYADPVPFAAPLFD